MSQRVSTLWNFSLTGSLDFRFSLPGVSLVCTRTRLALSMSGRSGICSGSLDPMRTHFKSEAVSGLLRLYGLPMVCIQPDHDWRSVTSSSNVCFFITIFRVLLVLKSELLFPTQVLLLRPVLHSNNSLDHLRGSPVEVKL